MTTFLKCLLLIAAASFLAGCATNKGSLCDGWKPIRPTAAEVNDLTDGTVHQILAHNRFGQQNCGWK